MRKLTRHQITGKNSLRHWTRIVSPLRVAVNFVVIYTCRFLPSLRLKNCLYRLVGMKIGKDVSVGLMAMFDIFFPELISIGENSIIGYNATVLAHEFLISEWATGRVEIGRDVLVSANTTVLAGVRIGDGAVVSACSLVNKDVPAKAKVGGVPARPLTARKER
ncbi:MAG: acyltransferase [bacterium]|jgi:acetyltransferase-like isoleucine patch superfamily enzyme